MSAGKTRYATGSRVRDAYSLSDASSARMSAASAVLAGVSRTYSGRRHASANGTTTRAPQKSPSHHVRATDHHELADSAPESMSETGPTNALMSVPAAIAPSKPTTPRRLES